MIENYSLVIIIKLCIVLYLSDVLNILVDWICVHVVVERVIGFAIVCVLLLQLCRCQMSVNVAHCDVVCKVRK